MNNLTLICNIWLQMSANTKHGVNINLKSSLHLIHHNIKGYIKKTLHLFLVENKTPKSDILNVKPT